MNWNHSSKILLVALLVAVAAVSPAAAVAASGENVPDTVQVEQTQDVTFTVSDLYTNYDEWTLRSHTDLSDVTWTVTTYDQTGAQIEQVQYNAANFTHLISAEDDVSEVTVRLQGTTPEVSEWQYDPPQKIVLASFQETQEGGAQNPIESYEARPYTSDSQSARQAIDAAGNAIQTAKSAGADTSEAEKLRQNAISAYDNGNFENAQDLANQSQNSAQGSQQSTERTNMMLYAGIGIVVLLVVIGAVYWYLKNRETYDKLG
jgi:hypothetical protein